MAHVNSCSRNWHNSRLSSLSFAALISFLELQGEIFVEPPTYFFLRQESLRENAEAKSAWSKRQGEAHCPAILNLLKIHRSSARENTRTNFCMCVGILLRENYDGFSWKLKCKIVILSPNGSREKNCNSWANFAWRTCIAYVVSIDCSWRVCCIMPI